MLMRSAHYIEEGCLSAVGVAYECNVDYAVFSETALVFRIMLFGVCMAFVMGFGIPFFWTDDFYQRSFGSAQ